MSTFNLAEFIDAKWKWSLRTFGIGKRTKGIVAHIRKECVEILDNPDDPEEPIDVILLAFDLLCRSGYRGEEIVAMLCAKQLKNTLRKWPDGPQSEDDPVEHIR